MARDTGRDVGIGAWPPADSVLDWLLDSDPSIRWQVLQDLVDADDVDAERARVADEGWGRRLLDEQRQTGNGAMEKRTRTGGRTCTPSSTCVISVWILKMIALVARSSSCNRA